MKNAWVGRDFQCSLTNNQALLYSLCRLLLEGRIRSPEWISGHVQIQLFQCKIIKSGHVQIQIFQSKIMRSGLVQIQLFPCEINKSGHVQIEIFVKGIWISGHVQIHHFATEIRRSGLNQSLMLASPDLYFFHWKLKIWTCPDLIFFHSNSWIWTRPDRWFCNWNGKIWTDAKFDVDKSRSIYFTLKTENLDMSRSGYQFCEK